MNSQLFLFLFSFLLISLGSSLHSSVYVDKNGITSDITYLSGALHTTAVDLVEPRVWGPDLPPTIIRDADFSFANLENVNLTYYTFINAKFTGANLKGANFQDTYFFGNTDFRYANLSETNFAYVHTDYANFDGADLTFANLSSYDPTIDEISVKGANLYGAWYPSQYRTPLVSYEDFYGSLGAIFQEIPESSTYALILGGLSLGFVLLRRK